MGDALDRDDMHTIKLMNRLNARNDRPIAQRRTGRRTGQDRARPAISLPATDLRTDQPALAQKLRQRRKHVDPGDRQPLSIHINDNMIPHAIRTLNRERGREKAWTWLYQLAGGEVDQSHRHKDGGRSAE